MSQQYTITITDTDRSYNSCKLYECGSPIPLTNTLIPLEYALFNNDIFKFNNKKLEIIQSPTRESILTGVLILENNKTYGRTSNQKRLFYKCIPSDNKLPIFLVPYDISLGFTKVQQNKFILFKFDNWNYKHPHGMITETIGDVDKLEPFYEYQLHCKNHQISLKSFTQKTHKTLTDTSDKFVETILEKTKLPIEDRRDVKVITIDPTDCLDFDDGFGIIPIIVDSIQIGWTVSVYISNVFFWLETLELWNDMTDRVSTIYLPDKKRPMLPLVLSDILCSLQQKQLRVALAMDVRIDMFGKRMPEPDSVQYKNVLISVSKNYAYDDPQLSTKNNTYKDLFIISKLMNTKINDSQDVVAHWMVLMNLYTGQILKHNKCGVFRTASYNEIKQGILAELTPDSKRVIQMWNNVNGQYVVFKENVKLDHELIENTHTDSSTYVQITSPIRRLVDVLNQIILFKNVLNYSISSEAEIFLQKWTTKMDYINTSMKSIRKIQVDCELLTRCVNNPVLFNTQFTGVVIEKLSEDTDDSNNSYMIYIEELKLISRIITKTELLIYATIPISLYLFEDEDKLKRKIRVQLM